MIFYFFKSDLNNHKHLFEPQNMINTARPQVSHYRTQQKNKSGALYGGGGISQINPLRFLWGLDTTGIYTCSDVFRL